LESRFQSFTFQGFRGIPVGNRWNLETFETFFIIPRIGDWPKMT
jgi:hypothetical protein